MEYLRFEREAAERHELIDGAIVAMAGATRCHNVLLSSPAAAPSAAGAAPASWSARISGGLWAGGKGWVGYYPDLAVYCTDEVHPLDPDTRIGPRLLVEVTSKSTEKKDRGVKLEDYLQIEALEEYLIVSHSRHELELWSRAADGWTRSLATNGSVELRSGATIDVERLYADLPD